MSTAIDLIAQRILQTQLFEHLGTAVNIDDSVIHVADWDTAMIVLRKCDWLNWLIRRQNELTSQLFSKARTRYNNEFDSSTNKYNDEIEMHVRKCADKIFDQNILDNLINDFTDSDLHLAIMEEHFSDVVPKAYFTYALEWYLKGHFPCGWEGEYPNGKLMVY